MKIIKFICLLIVFCLHLTLDGSAQSKKKRVNTNADKEDYDITFTKTEVRTSFPGGVNAWFEFANKEFDYEAVLQSMPADVSLFQDSVIVKFIVERFGELSNFMFEKGNPVLGEPVVRMLKSSPKWNPERQGGRGVRAYRRLRIDVLIDKDNNIKMVQRFLNSYNLTP